MLPKHRSALPVVATLATIVAFTLCASADRVFLTIPSNSRDIFQGCPMDVGIRVQYSDMAMLNSVQMQVLSADSTVLIENLHTSTRADWKETRSKTITWSVPGDWTPGEYVLRAFGNASYRCRRSIQSRNDEGSDGAETMEHTGERAAGHRARCDLMLEDRVTLQLHSLESGQECPKAQNYNAATSAPVPQEQGSSDSYARQNLDAINKNLAVSKGTVEDGGDIDNISDNGNETNDDDGSDNKGTEGFSTPLSVVLDHAARKRIQDQTIISVLNEIDDYSVKNNSLTLKNGTIVPMDTLLMDNSTKARFLHALEQSNSTISGSLGEGNGRGPFNSTALIATLHRNNDLIELPTMETDIVDWSDKGMNGTYTNGTHTSSGHGLGRELVQQGEDDDQIRGANGGSCLRTVISKSITMVVAASVIAMSTVL